MFLRCKECVWGPLGPDGPSHGDIVLLHSSEAVTLLTTRPGRYAGPDLRSGLSPRPGQGNSGPDVRWGSDTGRGLAEAEGGPWREGGERGPRAAVLPGPGPLPAPPWGSSTHSSPFCLETISPTPPAGRLHAGTGSSRGRVGADQHGPSPQSPGAGLAGCGLPAVRCGRGRRTGASTRQGASRSLEAGGPRPRCPQGCVCSGGSAGPSVPPGSGGVAPVSVPLSHGLLPTCGPFLRGHPSLGFRLALAPSAKAPFPNKASLRDSVQT